MLALCLLGAGCARMEGDAPKEAGAPKGVEEANVRTVAESTQATYGGLRIGVGYVHKGEYEEGGAKKQGLIAGLWLFPRGGQSRKLDVHEGERVVAGEYAFTVEKIEGGLKGVVRLRFDAPPPAAP